MAGDAAAAARSFDEQLAAAVARAQSAVSAAEAPEKTDEQIVEAIASAEAAAEAAITDLRRKLRAAESRAAEALATAARHRE